MREESNFPFFEEDDEGREGTGRADSTTQGESRAAAGGAATDTVPRQLERPERRDLSESDAPPARRSGSSRSSRGSRHRRTPSGSRKALLVLLIGFLVIILGIGAVVGYYFSRVDNALGNVQQDNLMPAPYAGQPAPSASQAMNVLVVGADQNDDGSDGRSDVLMIAHLSGDKKNIYLVSFPRDMWVDVPENRYVPRRAKAKINAAYSWGRAPLAVRTVEELTQVRMDHTAEINFGGFIEMTEKLGGVTVNNKHASTAAGYTYPKGEITVRGEEALIYVRQRYGLPNGDLDRAERQRAVLSAILGKATEPEVLANPVKFGEMFDLLSQQVVVDQTLPSSEVKRLVYGLQIRERGQIQSLQAPITGFGTSADGQSIAIVDEPQLAELSTALREDKMADYLAKYPS